MRAIHRITAFCVLSVFCLSGVARAQDSDGRRWEAFGQFGGAVFTDSKDLLVFPFIDPVTNLIEISSGLGVTTRSDTGKLFGGIRFRLNEDYAVEGSYQYSPNGVALKTRPLEPVPPLALPQGAVDSAVHIGSVNLVRYMEGNGRWRPFVTGGLGVAWFGPNSGPPKKFTVNFGAGLDFDLNSRVLLRVEYRDFLLTPAPMAFTLPQRLAHLHGPSVGLVYRF